MSATRRVLVLDYDVDSAWAIADVLETAIPKVVVIETHDAATAFEALAAWSFDLIVTEFNLQGMSGLEFISAAHAGGFHGDALIVTGLSVGPDFPSLGPGEVRLVPKPFDAGELVRQVTRLLDGVKDQRETTVAPAPKRAGSAVKRARQPAEQK